MPNNNITVGTSIHWQNVPSDLRMGTSWKQEMRSTGLLCSEKGHSSHILRSESPKSRIAEIISATALMKSAELQFVIYTNIKNPTNQT